MEPLQAQIIELKKEIARLRDIAERDALTGCLRRESFMDLIQKRKSFGSLPKNMTLVIADIDKFKNINDTHGHLEGDKALKSFADCLKQHLPEGSLLCRMGGEEFVMVLPDNVDENLDKLENLRLAIQALEVKSAKNQRIPLTASFGAVTWDTDQELLRATGEADMLLYRAKNSGRNRIAA